MRFSSAEYDGRNNSAMPSQAANACTALRDAELVQNRKIAENEVFGDCSKVTGANS